MNATKVPVAKFKEDCAAILRDVAENGKSIQVTDHGKILAVISPPDEHPKASLQEFVGSLKGTVTYSPGWDAPLGPEDWEACR
jgi:antitoxin (DNA-binding transcriptional repressor) of toxin-antitoxin stability system